MSSYGGVVLTSFVSNIFIGHANLLLCMLFGRELHAVRFSLETR